MQATILNPATGRLSVYEPRVSTKGTRPAAAAVVPTLLRNAVVTIRLSMSVTNLDGQNFSPSGM